jgi:hypothetical protein
MMPKAAKTTAAVIRMALSGKSRRPVVSSGICADQATLAVTISDNRKKTCSDQKGMAGEEASLITSKVADFCAEENV